jgi:hypothetical protein
MPELSPEAEALRCRVEYELNRLRGEAAARAALGYRDRNSDRRREWWRIWLLPMTATALVDLAAIVPLVTYVGWSAAAVPIALGIFTVAATMLFAWRAVSAR